MDAVRHIKTDTQATTGALFHMDQSASTMHKRLSRISTTTKRGVWLFTTISVGIIALVSAGALYGMTQFKNLGNDMQKKYASQITRRNNQLHDFSMQYNALMSQHTKATTRYQESIDALRQEIEQLRTENSQYSWLGEKALF